VAHFVLRDASVLVNAVDLSDDVESLSWPLSQSAEMDTSMGATAHTYLAGLKDSTVTVNFRSDFAAAQVWATLSAVYTAGVAVALKIRADKTAAISATNPELQANAILTSFDPIAGSVGGTANTSVAFQVTGAVTFDITP